MSKLLYHGEGKYSTQLDSKAFTKGECALMISCVNEFAMEDKAPGTMLVSQFDWGNEGQPLWVTFAYNKDGWNATHVNLSAPYKAVDLNPLLTKSTVLDTPNRVITVRVPVRALMSILGNWRHNNAIELPIMEGCQPLGFSGGKSITLPKDYEVIQTTVDMFARSVSVFISHSTFDEVIEGQIPPQYCMMTYAIEILHAEKVMVDKETNLPVPVVVIHRPE